MIARFRPSVARGSVDAPPSKTLAHRFLLAAALSESPSVVRGLCLSEDVLATIDCARSLGADVRLAGTDAHVDPQALPPSDLFPCRESGSTLRFFLPAALRRPTGSLFTGSPRLLERPLGVYEDLCRDRGLFMFCPAGIALAKHGPAEDEDLMITEAAENIHRFPGDGEIVPEQRIIEVE